MICIYYASPLHSIISLCLFTHIINTYIFFNTISHSLKYARTQICIYTSTHGKADTLSRVHTLTVSLPYLWSLLCKSVATSHHIQAWKKKVHISREFVVKQQGGENKRAPANEASNRCHFCTGSESTPSSHQLFFFFSLIFFFLYWQATAGLPAHPCRPIASSFLLFYLGSFPWNVLDTGNCRRDL